jgi:hypothetical protein
MPKGKSLHIGIANVDRSFGNEWTPLPSAARDATSMQNIAQACGFTTQLLVSPDATAGVVLDAIASSANTLSKGDIFFVTFSGHGSTVRGGNGRKRENAWVAYDRLVGRKELQRVFSKFQKGVRIVAVSDTCYSAGIMPLKLQTFLKGVLRENSIVAKAVPASTMKAAFRSKPMLPAHDTGGSDKLKTTMIEFSSSKSDEASIALPGHGLFTQKLLAVWDNGSFGGSYHEFFLAIKRAMIRLQTPMYKVRGPRNTKFEEERPFTI